MEIQRKSVMLFFKRQLFVFIALMFVCISAKSVVADDGADWIVDSRFMPAEEFIIKNGKIAIDAISEEGSERRCLDIKGLMDEIFDVSVMGRVALGRFSKKASESDISEYEELFKDYIFFNFLSQKSIDDVKGFEVTMSRVVSKKDVIVYAEIMLSDEEEAEKDKADEDINMEFRVRKYDDSNEMKIINVKVLSFDLVSALRGDIRSIMNSASNDFEEFLFDMGELVSDIKKNNKCQIFVKSPPS